MPPEHALTTQIRTALRAAGAATRAELQGTMGVSQATMSRALAPLLHSGEVHKVGRGPAQAYVMPRQVPGVASPVSVVRISAMGQASLFATLIPVTGGRYWLAEEGGPAALHGGLPWFLSDMRPQGFMGRSFAHAHPELDLAANPGHWNDDDLLRALTNAGEDLPGNLVLGAASFQRFHALKVQAVNSVSDYPALADIAMQGGAPGSSAGGENPKFCVLRAGRQVLVKFTAADDSMAAQRWRDLLRCEHLALRTLSAGGVAAATSEVFTAAGRVFLEVQRFDRTALGRIGMVSLMAFDAEFVGKMDDWAQTAARLAARGLLSDAGAHQLQLLEAFGRLIGNSDRHYGNVSLLLEQGQWRLAPAYDMLPMVYAPVGGELVPRDFAAGSIKPTTETLRVWPRAQAMARDFWAAVAQEADISEAFRALALGHAEGLTQTG